MKLLLLLVLATAGSLILTAQKGIKYEKRMDLLNAKECKASEVYLKKKIKAQNDQRWKRKNRSIYLEV